MKDWPLFKLLKAIAHIVGLLICLYIVVAVVLLGTMCIGHSTC